MGVRTIHDKYDDLTGEISDDVEQFTFVVDGIEYSMDACTATREGFRNLISKYTAVATKRVLGPGHNATAIREWARAEGIAVSDNGRLPDRVIEAYNDAHH